MEYKFSNIKDPETCPIADLENEVSRLSNLVDFYETKQLALKKFINSVYGAIASKYFIANNTAVAEAITLQGQDLNHFSENSVNAYFSGIFQNDTELHKKLQIDTELAKQFDISKGKTTDTGELTGPLFEYLDGTQSLTVAGDTDSVDEDTLIYLNNELVPISEAFLELKYDNNDVVIRTENGNEIVPVRGNSTLSYKHNNIVERAISYIMRHKVKKERYKIITESGKEVIVTGDHSCMVMRDGKLIEIKAKDINIDTDTMVTIND